MLSPIYLIDSPVIHALRRPQATFIEVKQLSSSGTVH